MPIAIRSDKIDLSSEKKTEELANKLSKKIKPGDIIFLHGEIGVGKTTFVRYLINELRPLLHQYHRQYVYLRYLYPNPDYHS